MRWTVPDLDRPELRPFDLPWNRPKLACRIDLALDAPTRLLLNFGRESLVPLVLHVVERCGTHFHHDRALGLYQRGQKAQQTDGDRHAQRTGNPAPNGILATLRAGLHVLTAGAARHGNTLLNRVPSAGPTDAAGLSPGLVIAGVDIIACYEQA